MDGLMIPTLEQSFILGIVQGITEFLPISSTAHLLITQRLFGILEPNLFFTTVIQSGSVLAIMVYFWKELTEVFEHLFNRNLRDFEFFIAGTLPVLIIGFLSRDVIAWMHQSLWVTSVALIGVAVCMALIELSKKITRTSEKAFHTEDLDWKSSAWIGLFQSLALIPGVSRSGITMIGGLTQKLSLEHATKASFLLGIPALGAATTYELLGGLLFQPVSSQLAIMTFVGFLFAFLSSLFSIHFTIGLVKKHGFWPFVGYRVFLGLAILFLL